jgi:hypothetical protein
MQNLTEAINVEAANVNKTLADGVRLNNDTVQSVLNATENNYKVKIAEEYVSI